jgi:CheY-like chemotaxis protein
LVVDDDKDICEAVRLILEMYGYRVATAADGAEALGLLRNGKRPFLIFLDLMMPGMNGARFREEQQRASSIADIPVVAVSGDGRVRDKAASIGVPDALSKPFDVPKLLEMVRKFESLRAASDDQSPGLRPGQ